MMVRMEWIKILKIKIKMANFFKLCSYNIVAVLIFIVEVTFYVHFELHHVFLL